MIGKYSVLNTYDPLKNYLVGPSHFARLNALINPSHREGHQNAFGSAPYSNVVRSVPLDDPLQSQIAASSTCRSSNFLTQN